MKIKMIATDKIKPDKNQPRKTFDNDKIKELAENYKKNGVIDPIEVDRNNTITLGERRWRASKMAGIKQIPCIIFNPKNDIERLERQIDEETLKEPIPYGEKLEALEKLAKMKGTDIKGLASELEQEEGKKKKYIEADIISKAPRDIKDLVKKEKIGARTAKQLRVSNLSDEKQIKLAKKIAKEGIGQIKAQEIIEDEEAKIEMKETLIQIRKEKRTPRDFINLVKDSCITLSMWLDRKYFPAIAEVLKKQGLAKELKDTLENYKELYMETAIRDLEE
jgi:ParB family chromosome partitioning protein